MIENQRLEKYLQINHKKEIFGQEQVINIINLLETYIINIDDEISEYSDENHNIAQFSKLVSQSLENLHDYFHLIDLNIGMNFQFLTDSYASIKKLHKKVLEIEKDKDQFVLTSRCIEKLSFDLFQLTQNIHHFSVNDFLILSARDQDCDFIIKNKYQEEQFNQFNALVENRKSVRNFLDIDVDITLIEKAMHLCEKIPADGNIKAHELLIIQDKELQKRLLDGQEENQLMNAPLLGLLTIDEKAFKEAVDASLHAGIFSGYLGLSFTSLGLSTCFCKLDIQNEEKMLSIIQEKYTKFSKKIMLLVWIGYEAPSFAPYKNPIKRNIKETLTVL